MKYFVCLSLARHAVARVIARRRAELGELAGVEWVPPRQMHVTLAFVGEKGAHMEGALLNAVRSAVLSFRLFSGAVLDVREIGSFGAAPEIYVWTRAIERVWMAPFVASLHHELAAIDAPQASTWKWVPHITLAKVSDPGAATLIKKAWRGVSFGNALVDRVTLMRSRRGSRGVVYDTLGEVLLGTGEIRRPPR